MGKASQAKKAARLARESGQVEQRRLEHGFVDSGTRPEVDGTTRDAEQPTEQTNRILIGEAQHDLPFFVEGPLSSRDAFFKASSSKA